MKKKKFHFVIIPLSILCILSSAHAIGLTVRFGEGVLWDDRVSDGALGGGQLALEIRMSRIPVAFQFAGEHWNQGTLLHSYEIERYETVKFLLFGYIGDIMPFLFTKPIKTKTTYLYVGGGIGRISVPQINDPDNREHGVAYDVICGTNIRLFWKIGLFVEGKYLYSSKITDHIKVIDFNDFGFLMGISFNFDLQPASANDSL